ncbi:hypothetical protein BBI01_13725 [Chryseobacterium artocarpi]|uniref:Secretion protein n=1 Tax=Chryseobacterium artocarpi TaxID=1414727 RepID=A0A1B8ZH75_9FLAO|nr:GEVED domain-containing protein [Chryseobacterium artocarpi]OCA70979.1 hypothetical protein BBI01_13725 [Chryseobacterium artocarpi]
MKKTFLYGAMLFSLSFAAQQQQRVCGFEKLLKENDQKFPGARLAMEKIVRKMRVDRNNPSSVFHKNVNGVYEIPVVVHVIEGGGSSFNRTDAQIQNWIENANKMYAGTYPWPVGGIPGDFGASAVFPIKLVLAKRTPNCTETTGIVRYNGSTIPGYSTGGVAQETNIGASMDAIKTLAPHWSEESYFNIYLISMFDGDTSPNSGLMGFAAFPNFANSNYESFMKAGVVTNLHDTTFAHEFGHAMGLYHTFGEADYSLPSTDPDYCPETTGNCEEDDDMVCDTERAGAAFYGAPPTNATINPCTQTNYQGVQYNMMNYSNSIAQKFTPGQGDRIDTFFMLLKSSLTTSKGATALPVTTLPTTPVAATCLPSGRTNSAAGGTLVGPTSVKLGSINNSTAGAWGGNPEFYMDYTTKNCIMNAHTELTVNQPQNVQVGFLGNPQSVRVWIDYNNNGTFETSELVASGNQVAVDPVSEIGNFSATFTPPATAVLNTPLRMRVLSDFTNPASITACGQLNYGQVEDYSVTLRTSLSTNEVKANNDDLVVYPNPVATGDKIFIKAKNGKNLKVSISDMAGRLVASPAVAEEGNGIYKVNQQLEKGVYMIQISNGKDSKTSKLIIK